jgi:hypothetical protein
MVLASTMFDPAIDARIVGAPRLAANIDSIMGVMVYFKTNRGVFLYIRMLQIACGQVEQNCLLVGESGPVL